jgi:2-amino-4-hydroxy-6-hydroxymethyldihydropteridine diphosphokinase
MSFALVSLGANLGDRAKTLAAAVQALGEHREVKLAAISSYRETDAVGGPAEQPAFLNAAVLLETSLSPRELLGVLQRIELQFGRKREAHWGARTLDLDLLLYDEAVLDEADLMLPHPRMAYRRFVLASAAEAAPHMRHPQIGWTVAELLNHLNTAPNYLAITGMSESGTDLARRVAEKAGVEFCQDPGISLDAQSTMPELAQRRMEAVRASLARSPQGVVSDFWIGQQQAYLERAGRHNLSLAGASRYEAVARNAPPPKLIVLLNDEAAETSRRGESLSERLQALVTQPRRGPFLVLNSAEFDRNLEELNAAAAAMR